MYETYFASLDDEEVEHPNEMPLEERAPEIDTDELPELPDVLLPNDAEVPEESRGNGNNLPV